MKEEFSALLETPTSYESRDRIRGLTTLSTGPLILPLWLYCPAEPNRWPFLLNGDLDAKLSL